MAYQAFVLNTGRVGGGEDQPDSKKVTIPCSSAIVQASSRALPGLDSSLVKSLG